MSVTQWSHELPSDTHALGEVELAGKVRMIPRYSTWSGAGCLAVDFVGGWHQCGMPIVGTADLEMVDVDPFELCLAHLVQIAAEASYVPLRLAPIKVAASEGPEIMRKLELAVRITQGETAGTDAAPGSVMWMGVLVEQLKHQGLALVREEP